MRRLSLTALTVVTALTASSCARNPATGGLQLSFISEAREIEMGREYDQQVVAQMGLYPEPALQSYVQELGSRLAAVSERPNLPWTFRVVDDPVVNAFALPGGFIYITRGILAHFQTEAQLAAVLGHEIGHVTARHSVNQLSKQQLAQIGLVIGAVVKPELQDYLGVASAGLGVLFLKFGRDDERQADDLGLRYMFRSSYDPREMAEVFTMLDRVSAASGGGRTPEWLSTHPNPVNRRGRIEQAIDTLPGDLGALTVNRDGYLGRLDGLVYGTNPREGFFRDGTFLHPELGFQLTFPEGWQTVNQKSVVAGVSPQEDGIIQLTLAQEPSPESAARAFFTQEGVSGGASETTINGLAAAAGDFSATTENAVLRGQVAFVSHGGQVFRVLGYAEQSRWSSYAAAAGRTIRSFDRLTDRTALDVQPQRLALVRPDRVLTVDQFMQWYPSPASADAVALLNQIPAGGRFPSGSLAKRIVGEPLP